MSASVPFTVNKLSESGAAEVLGFSWSSAGDPTVLDALKRTLWENPILAIRDANLTATQLAQFSRWFGPLDPNAPRPELTHPDDKDVLILSNEIRQDGTAVGVVDAGEEWHSDLTFRPVPALATILQLVQRPSQGGDTEFCNLYLVYDSLPPALKRRVAGLNALHHISKLRNPRVTISANRPSAAQYYTRLDNEPGVEHPIVRTHPQTGRQALFISPRFTIGIVGMNDQEAQPLLDELFGFMENTRFHYRHKWQDGDLVMWDNRCLNHRACGGYRLDDIRRLHRTCVLGDRPYYQPAA